MRIKNDIDHLKIGLLVLVAACTLSYAESKVRSRADATTPSTTAQSAASQDEFVASAGALPNEVTDAHKASKIIGMDVRNRENERVGRVKEIVLDVPSGKVAYAVVATGLRGDGKLIAVPSDALTLSPDALTLSPGAKSFVLDAPRDRIEAAPGLADNHWPGLDAVGNERVDGLAASSAESGAQDAGTVPKDNLGALRK